MHAYTVGLSLSYLDNTSATAESYAFLCAAPSTTRGHALYFREFLLLLGNKEKQRAGTIFHRCILNPSSHSHWHSLEIQLCIKNIFYYYRWLCESVSHVLWDCPAYVSIRSAFMMELRRELGDRFEHFQSLDSFERSHLMS